MLLKEQSDIYSYLQLLFTNINKNNMHNMK